MTGQVTALFQCYDCGDRFLACPECVCTIRVDPLTKLPPDVEIRDGKAVHVEPTPEATARSVKTPVCDNCVNRRNETYIEGGSRATHIAGVFETTEARHRRVHA